MFFGCIFVVMMLESVLVIRSLERCQSVTFALVNNFKTDVSVELEPGN